MIRRKVLVNMPHPNYDGFSYFYTMKLRHGGVILNDCEEINGTSKATRRIRSAWKQPVIQKANVARGENDKGNVAKGEMRSDADVEGEGELLSARRAGKEVNYIDDHDSQLDNSDSEVK